MSLINYDHVDDDYGDSVIHSVSKSHSQSVNQSFCHHSITNSESKYRVVQSIKIIQLTWKIVKALTNVVEMNCVENLKSKREIQIKLKQFFSTNDWVSLKSSPYSNGSCSWLKDMARTKHLYLSLVCRSDEAALKTSLIQPYSPCLKQHKKKLYHQSQVIRKSWSSEWAYEKTKEICQLIHSSPMYASIPRLCYRWWSMGSSFLYIYVLLNRTGQSYT